MTSLAWLLFWHWQYTGRMIIIPLSFRCYLNQERTKPRVWDQSKKAKAPAQLIDEVKNQTKKPTIMYHSSFLWNEVPVKSLHIFLNKKNIGGTAYFKTTCFNKSVNNIQFAWKHGFLTLLALISYTKIISVLGTSK